MKRVFKKLDGTIVNVINHTLQIMSEHPDVEIHVGTDSQNQGSRTSYSTVIAYRYGSRGAHIIVSNQKVPRIRDFWSRLWKEAELSVETAEWITKQINVRIEIDMDYNCDKVHKSSSLVNAAKGWANSLGYKVNIKPDNQIATKAADAQCR